MCGTARRKWTNAAEPSANVLDDICGTCGMHANANQPCVLLMHTEASRNLSRCVRHHAWHASPQTDAQNCTAVHPSPSADVSDIMCGTSSSSSAGGPPSLPPPAPLRL